MSRRKQWLQQVCWLCQGKGVVAGPYFAGPCWNENCPHRARQLITDLKRGRS